MNERAVKPTDIDEGCRYVCSAIGALNGGYFNDYRVVFNTDASLGIGFTFASNAKFTPGYRVDTYFDALRSPTAST